MISFSVKRLVESIYCIWQILVETEERSSDSWLPFPSRVVSPALSDIYLAYASMVRIKIERTLGWIAYSAESQSFLFPQHYQKVLESKSFGKVFRELATGTYPAASGDLFSKFILSKGELWVWLVISSFESRELTLTSKSIRFSSSQHAFSFAFYMLQA